MKFKTLIITSLLASLTLNAFSINDTIILKSDIYSERISRDLDSLVNSWSVKMALKEYPVDVLNDTTGKEFPDSVYRDRLSTINSIIKLPYNSVIRNNIHVYTVQHRKKFSVILGLSEYYFPMIEDIFDSYGLPEELKNLAIIESALNPGIVNRYSGATGLWQFMISTGRLYGLTINSVVDERRDPIKATHAAARYLRDLYNIYNDWILVIAAYNCGPGNVNKAIHRSGDKKDYWDIYYRLPRETRGYIPQYVAAIYGVNFYAEHGIKPLPLNIPISTDTIMINSDIHLTQISEVMGIPLEELKALNPQYKTGLIPGTPKKPMSLTLPFSYLGNFIDLNDTIRNYKPDVYLKRINNTNDPTRSTSTHVVKVEGKTKILYTVKGGDNLGFISEWFNVRASDLRYWNNIYRNTIRVGQKIIVYVDPSKADYYSKITSMSFEEKQQMDGKTVPSNPVSSTPQQTLSDGEYVTYTVRIGDTIWDIVKMYDNVSAREVLSLNNISDPGSLQVGQKIKIKKKS